MDLLQRGIVERHEMGEIVIELETLEVGLERRQGVGRIVVGEFDLQRAVDATADGVGAVDAGTVGQCHDLDDRVIEETACVGVDKGVEGEDLLVWCGPDDADVLCAHGGGRISGEYLLLGLSGTHPVAREGRLDRLALRTQCFRDENDPVRF